MPLRVPEEYVEDEDEPIDKESLCACGSAICNSEQCFNPNSPHFSDDKVSSKEQEEVESVEHTASFFEKIMMRYDTERESDLNRAYLQNRKRERELEKKREQVEVYDSEIEIEDQYLEEVLEEMTEPDGSDQPNELSTESITQKEVTAESGSHVSIVEPTEIVPVGSDTAITWNYECLCNFVQNKNRLLDRYLKYYQRTMKYTKYVKQLIAHTDMGKSHDVATMFNSTKCGLALPRPRVPAINRRIDQSPFEFLNEQSKLVKEKKAEPVQKDKFIIINASELNDMLENQTRQTVTQRVIPNCTRYDPGKLIPCTSCASMSSIPDECSCITSYERKPTFSKSLNDKSKLAKEVVKQLNVA